MTAPMTVDDHGKKTPTGDISPRWWLRLGHDLRAPIAPMRMAVQLLRNGQGSPAEQREAMDVLDRQIDQLLANIEDLADLARVNAGIFKMDRVPGDLNLVMDIVSGRNALLRRLDSKQQTLNFVSTGSPVITLHDPARMIGLVEFLVGKMARHAAAGTALTVHLEKTQSPDRAQIRMIGAGESLAADPELAFVLGQSTMDVGDFEAKPIVMREIARLHDVEFDRQAPGLAFSLPLCP